MTADILGLMAWRYIEHCFPALVIGAHSYNAMFWQMIAQKHLELN